MTSHMMGHVPMSLHNLTYIFIFVKGNYRCRLYTDRDSPYTHCNTLGYILEFFVCQVIFGFFKQYLKKARFDQVSKYMELVEVEECLEPW